MEGSDWVMLVCSGSTLQYQVHQEQGQVQESVNSASVIDHGDHDDATDSSQSDTVFSGPWHISK